MKRLLAILVFVLILMALLGVFDKCNGADLGYAVGQNRVQMVELNYGVFNYARHTHDGTTMYFRYGLSILYRGVLLEYRLLRELATVLLQVVRKIWNPQS